MKKKLPRKKMDFSFTNFDLHFSQSLGWAVLRGPDLKTSNRATIGSACYSSAKTKITSTLAPKNTTDSVPGLSLLHLLWYEQGDNTWPTSSSAYVWFVNEVSPHLTESLIFLLGGLIMVVKHIFYRVMSQKVL